MLEITVDYVYLKKILKRLQDNDPCLSEVKYCPEYSLEGAGDWQKSLVDAIEKNTVVKSVDFNRFVPINM